MCRPALKTLLLAKVGIHYLLETVFREVSNKSIGRRKTTDFDPDYDLFTISFFEAGGGKIDVFKKTAARSYKQTKGKFRNDLFRNFDEWQTGRISKTEFKKRWINDRKKAFEKAVALGAASTGNPFYDRVGISEIDEKFLKKALRAENQFSNKFINDVVNEEGKMLYERRLQMHVDSLDGQFWTGFVLGLPPDTRFHWTLHPAEHCIDCINMAAASLRAGGFTRDELPFTPRDGQTQCKTNCRCTLEIKLPKLEPSPAIEKPGRKKAVDKDAQLMNYYRQMISITEGKEQRKFIKLRQMANKRLIARGTPYVPLYSVGELKRVVRSVNNAKEWTLAKSISSLKRGQTIVAVHSKDIFMGEIKRKSTTRVVLATVTGDVTLNVTNTIFFNTIEEVGEEVLEQLMEAKGGKKKLTGGRWVTLRDGRKVFIGKLKPKWFTSRGRTDPGSEVFKEVQKIRAKTLDEAIKDFTPEAKAILQRMEDKAGSTFKLFKNNQVLMKKQKAIMNKDWQAFGDKIDEVQNKNRRRLNTKEKSQLRDMFIGIGSRHHITRVALRKAEALDKQYKETMRHAVLSSLRSSNPPRLTVKFYEPDRKFFKGKRKEITKRLHEVASIVDSKFNGIKFNPTIRHRYGRAQATKFELYLHNKSSKKTIYHETGHFIEDSFGANHMKKRAIEFWFKRTGGLITKKIDGDPVGSGNFISDYAGKIYQKIKFGKRPKRIKIGDIISANDIDSTEIVSIGIQNLMTDPIGFANTDFDFFRFTMGVLKGRI